MIDVDLGDREESFMLADSILKRGIGLSFRKKGKMLFKFSNDVRWSIDMAFMLDELYLYFLNSDKEVIYVEKAEPWYKMPEKFFHRPDESYRYLLESFEDLGLREGDQVDF